MGQYRIMIVEDDSSIAASMKRHLQTWDYEVLLVEDFKHVMDVFFSFEPELVFLDIALPFYNGFYWCGEIRKVSKVPVVFISSIDDNMNIVMAMDMGADDFITKPFDLTVLTAKTNAMLRRTYSYQGRMDVVEYQGVVLHISNGSIHYQGQQKELTKNEFIIMKILMENAGSIVSRDTIIMSLWEDDNFIDDNTLTVNITRIRKKLNELGIPEFIKTKKGIGYMI